MFTIEPMINTGSWRDKLWPVGGWVAGEVGGGRSAPLVPVCSILQSPWQGPCHQPHHIQQQRWRSTAAGQCCRCGAPA